MPVTLRIGDTSSTHSINNGHRDDTHQITRGIYTHVTTTDTETQDDTRHANYEHKHPQILRSSPMSSPCKSSINNGLPVELSHGACTRRPISGSHAEGPRHPVVRLVQRLATNGSIQSSRRWAGSRSVFLLSVSL